MVVTSASGEQSSGNLIAVPVVLDHPGYANGYDPWLHAHHLPQPSSAHGSSREDPSGYLESNRTFVLWPSWRAERPRAGVGGVGANKRALPPMVARCKV